MLFRVIEQTLGRTRPKLRTPAAADRWTWLIIAAHTQLRLARLVADLRPPWEKPAQPRTPARLEEPAPRHPLRRGQNDQLLRHHRRT